MEITIVIKKKPDSTFDVEVRGGNGHNTNYYNYLNEEWVHTIIAGKIEALLKTANTVSCKIREERKK